MSRVTVVGCGYVGVCSALALAEQGHRVVAFDTDPGRRDALKRGRVPFFEPGVERLLRRHLRSGRFTVASSLGDAVDSTNLSLVCVGTPSRRDGSIDLRQIRAVAADLGRELRKKSSFHTVAVKSTVVPGTLEDVVVPILERASGKRRGQGFGAASNPEFLREGSAMRDALHPDRVVIGAGDARSARAVGSLYGRIPSPKVVTDPWTAEMIKYAANSFLATKVALSNELANICERVGVDWYDVAGGIAPDARIGPLFLRAGAGFGGSCFPKDVAAIAHLGRRAGARSGILEAVARNNKEQPEVAVRLLKEALGSLAGKRVALLGLAFKPETDDVRETRAFPIYRALRSEGAQVVVYDPRAVENFRRLAPDAVAGSSMEEALRDADGAIVQTEWPEFRNASLSKVRRLMKTPLIVDGRRTFEPHAMERAGFDYRAIGLGRRVRAAPP